MNKELKEKRKAIKSIIDRAEKIDIDYIQCFDGVFNAQECDNIIKKIDKFNSKGFLHKGEIGKGFYEKAFKESSDINLYPNSGKDYKDKDIDDIYKLIHSKIGICVYSYLMSVGVLGIPFLGINMYNAKKIIPEDKIPEMPEFFVLEKMNLRKYKKNKGGYYMIHYDASTRQDRLLAVVVYLNDIDYGGETSFPLIKRDIKPKAGRIAIFPSFFTHLHYGKTSASDKYIIASHIIDTRLDFENKKKENNNGNEMGNRGRKKR